MELQQVILVNDRDEPIGLMEKLEAHQKGLLHRAFSIFIFNSSGELLLQRRSLHKYHSGGLWTNTCCSHPSPAEDILAAAQRRLNEEMGFTAPLEKIFDFIYKAEFDNGLVEYEFDHVFAENTKAR
jgi:isopentenyl-diphosphate delta-isomerase